MGDSEPLDQVIKVGVLSSCASHGKVVSYPEFISARDVYVAFSDD